MRLAVFALTVLIASSAHAKPLLKTNKKSASRSGKEFIDINAQNQLRAKKQTQQAVAQRQMMQKGGSAGDMVMIVNPEMRANDLKEAFAFLKASGQSLPISIHLADGRILTRVTAIEVMKGGTMVVVKNGTIKGQKFHIIGVENIESITHE